MSNTEKTSENKQKISQFVAVIILTAAIFGAGGFYGGMKYQQSQTPARGNFVTRFGQSGAPTGQGNRTFAGRLGGGATMGKVVSMDDQSFTLEMPDGGSKIVLYTDKTTLGKMTTVSMNELTEGENVTVLGEANQDGSVTASSVQIRPEGQFVPQGASGASASNSTSTGAASQ